MNFRDAVFMAAQIAYEEDANQIVVSADMERFFVFHKEDPEAMTFKHWIYVTADGILQVDLAEMLDRAGIEGDQDWENETTTWTLPCGTGVRASGAMVEFE